MLDSPHRITPCTSGAIDQRHRSLCGSKLSTLSHTTPAKGGKMRRKSSEEWCERGPSIPPESAPVGRRWTLPEFRHAVAASGSGGHDLLRITDDLRLRWCDFGGDPAGLMRGGSRWLGKGKKTDADVVWNLRELDSGGQECLRMKAALRNNKSKFPHICARPYILLDLGGRIRGTRKMTRSRPISDHDFNRIRDEFLPRFEAIVPATLRGQDKPASGNVWYYFRVEALRSATDFDQFIALMKWLFDELKPFPRPPAPAHRRTPL